MEAALWREEFTYMKFGRSYTVTLPRRSVFLSMSSKWKSFSLCNSFRIGTNDSVDQIFLFLHHHFLYHVYVHDPRLNQLPYSNNHLLLKVYDKSMNANFKGFSFARRRACLPYHSSLPPSLPKFTLCSSLDSFFCRFFLINYNPLGLPSILKSINPNQSFNHYQVASRIVLSSMILYLLYLTLIYIFCNCVCWHFPAEVDGDLPQEA